MYEVLDRLDLGGDLPVDFGDLVVDLNHGRIARLEGLQLLLVFLDKDAAFAPQSVDDGVGQQLGQIHALGGFDLLPQLLVPDAVGNQIAQRRIGGGEIVFGDRRLFIDDDDLLLLGEIQNGFSPTPQGAASTA